MQAHLWRWLERSGAAIFACLASAILMRQLARGCDPAVAGRLGIMALMAGIGLGWQGVHQWKSASSTCGAAMLGLCAGIGGAGLFLITG